MSTNFSGLSVPLLISIGFSISPFLGDARDTDTDLATPTVKPGDFCSLSEPCVLSLGDDSRRSADRGTGDCTICGVDGFEVVPTTRDFSRGAERVCW